MPKPVEIGRQGHRLSGFQFAKYIVTCAEDFKQRNPILWWDPNVVGYAEDGRIPTYRS